MIPKTGNRPKFNSSLQALSLSALGVVFGDIGTSPLYTLKTVLALTGGKPDLILFGCTMPDGDGVSWWCVQSRHKGSNGVNTA
jgi:hypothetical protein